jgi:tRNA(fMet)-specific endonuclease VapC
VAADGAARLSAEIGEKLPRRVCGQGDHSLGEGVVERSGEQGALHLERASCGLLFAQSCTRVFGRPTSPDTNTLILLERLNPAQLPEEPVITAVTLAELSVGPLVADDVQERAARQARLQEAEASFEPLPFDASAARVFGRVAAGLHRSGRNPAARAFDALIAATAIANGMDLYTCNPRDYVGIDDLEVIGIAHPDNAE